MTWKQQAILMSGLAAFAVALAAFATTQHSRTFARVACYVALANDVGPLVARDMPDTAAASRECRQPALQT